LHIAVQASPELPVISDAMLADAIKQFSRNECEDFLLRLAQGILHSDRGPSPIQELLALNYQEQQENIPQDEMQLIFCAPLNKKESNRTKKSLKQPTTSISKTHWKPYRSTKHNSGSKSTL
jgi:hypothetical protein